MKRINKNENGISGFSILSIIIAIAIIFTSWQYLAPSFGYPSITDLVYGEEPVYADLYIFDHVTGEETKLTRGISFPKFATNYELQIEGHIYSFILKTNAPFLFGDNFYKMVYSYQNVAYLSANNGELMAFSTALPYSAIWSNTFTYTIQGSNSHNVLLEFHLYDHNGNIFAEWDMTLEHAVGLGDFP
jgi:hypothetical protein